MNGFMTFSPDFRIWFIMTPFLSERETLQYLILSQRLFTKLRKRSLPFILKKRVKIRDFTLFLCYDFKGMGEEVDKIY